MGVIRFQKIFGLFGLKGHIVDKRWDVTLVHGWTHGRMEFEYRARILDSESAIGLIHSCSAAASVAEAEGGGKSRRRVRPARNCIVSFSYLFRIPTACHLFADHFPRPTRSKSPKRSTAQGQGSHFTATRYVQLPWAIHHNRNLSGFP